MTTRPRASRLLFLLLIVALAATNLTCTGSVGVGISAPVGSAWGGPGFGTVGFGVSVPIGR